MSAPVLEVQGLAKAFGGVRAVIDVSLSVAAGEMLALIGPNGAGKSTCFNLLNGQLRADAGTVALKGRSLLGLTPRAIWRLGVGRTFQITATFGSMTVAENVQMALISHHGRVWSFTSSARHMFRDQAVALLAQLGMADQADRPAAVLAYGDLKRLELAVALANDPAMLLMDEPTAGMAPAERVALIALTREIVRARGLACLFTEHDMDVVFGQADRILVMNRGEVLAEGDADSIRANPRVREVYLGTGATSGGH